MTQNAKMRAPKEMATETFMPDWEAASVAKAQKRMGCIVAGAKEVEQYGFNPNGARNNRRPGIPLEDYTENPDRIESYEGE